MTKKEESSFLREIVILLIIVTIVSITFSQLVVVPTESMNPAIKAGDMVLVEKTNVLGVFGELNPDDVKVGDIIVYSRPVESQQEEENSESKSESLNESIIHRVIAVSSYEGQKYLILKGDNNPVSDSEGVETSQIVGRVVLWDEKPIVIPGAGHAVIFLKDLIYGGE